MYKLRESKGGFKGRIGEWGEAKGTEAGWEVSEPADWKNESEVNAAGRCE